MNKVYIVEGKILVGGSNNQTTIISKPVDRLFYRSPELAEKALEKIKNSHNSKYDKYYVLVICEYILGELE